ncbi:lipoprotein LppA [Mycoplasmopsis canis PG 14]|uniref:Lipoprotein LppA n=1 Tax=Mycoplasmopsis canis TaxID=29555 RepID=A0A449AQX8_9BACT|nr:hypothetical protein [Mycoplasmopsis canis]AMD81151.1 hypothetical protein AXW82_01065 [Mycoplasmopsis canis PG 14]EIE39784.1 lipoprotein LppA [Mycoplasmopsis canis PG 14]VEU68974.1 lipoprotein LppA [Mycoplasmopsis canis]
MKKYWKLTLLISASLTNINVISCSQTKNDSNMNIDKENTKPMNPSTNNSNKGDLNNKDSFKKPIEQDEKLKDNSNKVQNKKDDDDEEDFSDVINFKTEFIINDQNISSQVASKYLLSISDQYEVIYNLIEIDNKVKERFNIDLVDTKNIISDDEDGIIKNIQINFISKKSKKIVSKKITLKGFLIPKQETINESKQSEILIKKNLEDKYKNIFPSLLASMLMLNKSINDRYEYYNSEKNTSDNDESYGFYTLEDYAMVNSLFKNASVRLNPSLPFKFLDIKDSYIEKYQYRIQEIKANDLTGQLSLKVILEHIEENVPKRPSEVFIYNFDGFRRHNNLENFEFYLDSNEFIERTKENTRIKNKLNSWVQESNSQDLKNYLNEQEIHSIKQLIFKSLKLKAKNDKVYSTNENGISLENLASLKNNIVLYPFVTRFAESIIENFDITIDDNKNILIKTKLNIPIYASDDYDSFLEINGFNDQIQTNNLATFNSAELKK